MRRVDETHETLGQALIAELDGGRLGRGQAVFRIFHLVQHHFALAHGAQHQEPGVGAELAGAQGDRAVQPGGDLGTAGGVVVLAC